MINNILYKSEYAINDFIKIRIPTVGEIIENDDEYYNMVNLLTAMPIDAMVYLYDNGIDFATINEYDLFLHLFPSLKSQNTSLIFGDLDLSRFDYAVNQQNGNVVVADIERDIAIDRAIHSKIADVLRTIHHLEKNKRKPANKDAQEFMIERARKKLKRMKSDNSSRLEPLIIAMVNTEQYKYDFEGTKNLSIYQFNESVKQVVKKIDYDNITHGIYAGLINPKELNQSDLNWLVHK